MNMDPMFRSEFSVLIFTCESAVLQDLWRTVLLIFRRAATIQVHDVLEHVQYFLKLIPRPRPRGSLIHLKMSDRFLAWRNLEIFVLTRSPILTDSELKTHCLKRFR